MKDQVESITTSNSNSTSSNFIDWQNSLDAAFDFMDRREFVSWMSALVGVLTTTACTKQSPEKILPYSKQPEGMILGKPLFFATSHPFNGDYTGLLVESHEGRPTKIEGNNLHPGSLGGQDRFNGASLLNLYDPDRCKAVSYRGVATSWNNFRKSLQETLESQRPKEGAGLRILSNTVYSPALASRAQELLSVFPKAKWYSWDAADQGFAVDASQKYFNEVYSSYYDFSKAKCILSLDCDFTDQIPGHIRYSRDFFSKRRDDKETFNRLYHFECSRTVTGSIADHRFAVDEATLFLVSVLIARELGVALPAATPSWPSVSEPFQQVAREIASDLSQNKGESLVLAGTYQAPVFHMLAHAINEKLRNIGETVLYIANRDQLSSHASRDLKQLVRELDAKQVDLLLILGGNPVLSVPPDLGIATAIENATLSVNLSEYTNETSRHCHWQIPQTHYLESWGDGISYDGTYSINQPLIAPLYNGKSELELLSLLVEEKEFSPYEYLRSTWKKRAGANEKDWRRYVHDGIVFSSLQKNLIPQARSETLVAEIDTFQKALEVKKNIQVVIRPDPNIFDGTFSNNAWLQELPKPFTKVTWDNVIHISPSLATSLNVKNGQIVEISNDLSTIKGPVWIVPGQPENSITLFLGYGRTAAGRIGNKHGYNAYLLRGWEKRWTLPLVQIKPTAEVVKLACTQEHHQLGERDLVHHYDVTKWQELLATPFSFSKAHHDTLDASHVQHAPDSHKSFEEDFLVDKNYAWGMEIDLSLCNGCNACVVSCQSENNIPTVGKDQVLKGRELHWLRIDEYYDGDTSEVLHQPLPCMHCEKAPCELVCPVNATTHSPDGINEMTYNRCVGTRYCGNNCPYKVRRFNYLQYADVQTPVIQLGRNPEVTVRSRGVMEKCTYCVQRVRSAKHEAKLENRAVKDGDLKTACQAACPSQAIVFGNLRDPESEISKLKKAKRHYNLLEELGVFPRTGYQAKLSNPNPAVTALFVQQKDSPA